MIDHSHLSAPEVIHEARIAAGCKPGESLIERCRDLNAAGIIAESTPITAIRGESSPAEWKPCKLTYDAVLQRAEGLTDEHAAEWVGKPVLDRAGRQEIGRVVMARRLTNCIVGTVEFDGAAESIYVLAGEIVGPFMFRSAAPAPLTVELEGAPEPEQETWRDRPPML